MDSAPRARSQAPTASRVLSRTQLHAFVSNLDATISIDPFTYGDDTKSHVRIPVCIELLDTLIAIDSTITTTPSTTTTPTSTTTAVSTATSSSSSGGDGITTTPTTPATPTSTTTATSSSSSTAEAMKKAQQLAERIVNDGNLADIRVEHDVPLGLLTNRDFADTFTEPLAHMLDDARDGDGVGDDSGGYDDDYDGDGDGGSGGHRRKRAVNWAAVVIKLHQSLLATDLYDQVKQLQLTYVESSLDTFADMQESGSAENTTGRRSAKKVHFTTDQDDSETPIATPRIRMSMSVDSISSLPETFKPPKPKILKSAPAHSASPTAIVAAVTAAAAEQAGSTPPTAGTPTAEAATADGLGTLADGTAAHSLTMTPMSMQGPFALTTAAAPTSTSTASATDVAATAPFNFEAVASALSAATASSMAPPSTGIAAGMPPMAAAAAAASAVASAAAAASASIAAPPSTSDVAAAATAPTTTTTASEALNTIHYLPRPFDFVVFWGCDSFKFNLDLDDDDDYFDNSDDDDDDENAANKENADADADADSGEMVGGCDDENVRNGFPVNLRWILLALNVRGSLDTTLVQLITHTLNTTKIYLEAQHAAMAVVAETSARKRRALKHMAQISVLSGLTTVTSFISPQTTHPSQPHAPVSASGSALSTPTSTPTTTPAPAAFLTGADDSSGGELLGITAEGDNAAVERLSALWERAITAQMDSLKYDTYLVKILSSRTGVVLSALRELEADVACYVATSQALSMRLVERLLISMLGHVNSMAREYAVRLLNMLYDGHTWQQTAALPVLIRGIGDTMQPVLVLREGIPPAHDREGRERIVHSMFLQLYRPNPLLHSTKSHAVLLPLRVQSEADDKMVLAVAEPIALPRAGFYDWRFVTISATDGELVPYVATSNGLSEASASKASSQTLSSQFEAMQIAGNLVQGRVVAVANLKDESIHEVWVDAQSARWDPTTGAILQRGNFAAVGNAIDDYAANKITTIHVLGAMERAVFHPWAATDRSRPSTSGGGAQGFSSLVEKARSRNIKVVVEMSANVGTRRAHRKYDPLVCNTLDAHGRVLAHLAVDGREVEWPDAVMLNYRKKDSWDLLVDDVLAWPRNHAVSGVVLRDCHLWPLLLEPDLAELMRKDSDGEYHYSLQDILNAEIVSPMPSPTHRQQQIQQQQQQQSASRRSLGYWTTKAAATYANPLFVKIVRRLWADFPHFIVVADMHPSYGRERSAVISGLLPMANRIPQLLTACFSEQRLAPIPRRSVNFILRMWYERVLRKRMPAGAMFINPSSGPLNPYPLIQYGGGSGGSGGLAFAYISLLYALPEAPMTFFAEKDGVTFTVDIASGKFNLHQPTTVVSPDTVKKHYQMSMALRMQHQVLRTGKLLFVQTYDAATNRFEMESVLSFVRYTDSQFMICIVNCSAHEVSFGLDLSAALSEPDIGALSDFHVYDVLSNSQRQYYAALEFLQTRHPLKLPPFGTALWKVHKLPQIPQNQRAVFSNSMARLRQILAEGRDPTHNHIYATLIGSLAAYRSFRSCLAKFQSAVAIGSDDETGLPKLIQEALFTASTRPATASKAEPVTSQPIIMSYLIRLATKENNKLARDILQVNTLGPLVFVTPEIAPWSKMGGIAVMVDELTQDLAKLGLDVRVISPYYNWNREGKTDYLRRDGFEHTMTFSTTMGAEYVEVGLHHARLNGVEYYFVHNFQYFPYPYHTGSPEHQLKMIVLMAKASLEALCQLRILPAIIITNDWFTALVPGYARCGEFGSVFNGVTFFHLIHNLEEGYQGLIWPEAADLLRGVHGLPESYLVDYLAAPRTLNASRCALLCSNQWGTVSRSYLDDLRKGSPYTYILNNTAQYPQPFAHSNGIRVQHRRERIHKVAASHADAKRLLQRKYFGREDPTIAVFSFVGRITVQKGVHLILDAARTLIEQTNGKVQFIVGGQADRKDKYAEQRAWQMLSLRHQFPGNFWADPDAFFTDGDLATLGSDFGLMPSLFEPSGVVQQECFVAGTPVIAFYTGGLKDTVFEFDAAKKTGNGFIFLAHQYPDFVFAVKRALQIFNNSELYEVLRANAEASVLDTLVVARAWGKEFCRLRKRLWIEPAADSAADDSAAAAVDSESDTSTADNVSDSGSESTRKQPPISNSSASSVSRSSA